MLEIGKTYVLATNELGYLPAGVAAPGFMLKQVKVR